MREYTAKKLGEVLAFARVANDTLEKGHEGFGQIFTEEQIERFRKENDHHAELLEDIAEEDGVEDVMHAKADATEEKLNKMRNTYLTSDDDWADPAELLEWSGLFYGGAIVHWSLVQGAADGMENVALQELARDGISFHHDMLKQTSDTIATLEV